MHQGIDFQDCKRLPNFKGINPMATASNVESKGAILPDNWPGARLDTHCRVGKPGMRGHAE
jgi:hypothetical protein